MTSITLYEKISIDTLTMDGVNTKKQYYVINGGVEYVAGNIVGKMYRNSEQGRAAVITDLPEQYATAIMAVWGDTPTVTEEESNGANY